MVTTKPPVVTVALDEEIAALEEERLPDGKWHPSSMWMCERQAVLGVRGAKVTNPPDLQSKRRFRLGHMIHELTQSSLFRIRGVRDVYLEFPVVYPGRDVKGNGDALLIMDNDDGWVVELKSAKKAALKRGLNEHHSKQARTYAVSVRLHGVPAYEDPGGELHTELPALGPRLKGIIVVYVEKEDLLTAEHVIKYDPAWEREIDDKIEELEMYRADPESLPPCYGKTKDGAWLIAGKVKYCPFYPACHEPAVEPKQEEVPEW